MVRIIFIKSGSAGLLFKEYLEMEGHQVVAVARDQYTAANVLHDKSIEADVVITGLNLYRFTGDPFGVMAYEMADSYRQRGLPIIILSVYCSRLGDWPKEMRDNIVVVEDPSRVALLNAIKDTTT